MMTDRLVRTSHGLQAIASCYVTMYVQELVATSNQSNERYNRYSVVGMCFMDYKVPWPKETSAYHTINTLSL